MSDEPASPYDLAWIFGATERINELRATLATDPLTRALQPPIDMPAEVISACGRMSAFILVWEKETGQPAVPTDVFEALQRPGMTVLGSF